MSMKEDTGGKKENIITNITYETGYRLHLGSRSKKRKKVLKLYGNLSNCAT